MTAPATCVAAMGMHHDQVAVVSGAMVIAPLLGHTALGNRRLLLTAARALGCRWASPSD